MTDQSVDVLDRLMAQIHCRAAELPADSYTTKLIIGGVPAMGAKILEEAQEVVDAAEQSVATAAPEFDPASPDKAPATPDNQHLIHEACDVIYHLWVLLGSRGVSVDDLRQELERREGTSGLQEKSQRNNRA